MSADVTQSRPPVVVVTGPTASGKTELAIEIAERFDGEIVNADSMQIYRELDIGTAKPTLAQRARVPHHMLDVVSPNAKYNAGLYQRDRETDRSSRRPWVHMVMLVSEIHVHVCSVLLCDCEVLVFRERFQIALPSDRGGSGNRDPLLPDASQAIEASAPSLGPRI